VVTHEGDGVLVLVLIGVNVASVVSVDEALGGVAAVARESEVDDAQRLFVCGQSCVELHDARYGRDVSEDGDDVSRVDGVLDGGSVDLYFLIHGNVQMAAAAMPPRVVSVQSIQSHWQPWSLSLSSRQEAATMVA